MTRTLDTRTGDNDAGDNDAGRSVARHNMRCASQLARALTAGAPTHVVVSPGSRSTPLALAFDALAEVEIHVVLDERAAAFLALGIARGSGRPAIALCTSGSAGAHYGPACVEAAYARVPLLLLTANRPPELQHCGAPQTIAQDRLLPEPLRLAAQLPVAGPEVSDSWLQAFGARARQAACGSPPGPVHLDVPFREPLWHADHPPPSLAPAAGVKLAHPKPAPSLAAARQLLAGPLAAARGLIVCGPHIGPYDGAVGAAARKLAGALGWPIVAEAASGVRFDVGGGSGVVQCADAMLRSPRFAALAEPDALLLVGQTPTSKPLRQWLASMPGRALSLDPDGQLSDPTGCTALTVAGDTVETLLRLTQAAEGSGRVGDQTYTQWWQQADETVREALLEHVQRGEWEGRVAYQLTRALRQGSQLFVGSSMPIRDLDCFASATNALAVSANRGCNGIDGGVATAAGIALANGTPTVAWLGDLALLHDLDGLEALGCGGWPLTLVVVNNNGGGIFDQLPIAAHQSAFERLFTTPRKARIAPLCEALGIQHQQVALGDGSFVKALQPPTAGNNKREGGHGPRLLEIIVDRRQSAQARAEAWRAATTALESWLAPPSAAAATTSVAARRRSEVHS